MPLLKNPAGMLVCVTDHMADYWLRAMPLAKDYKGNITKPGYSVPDDPEAARKEYIADMKKAEERLADTKAKELAESEASAFSIAKGLLRQVGGGKEDKPRRGRKAKKDDE